MIDTDRFFKFSTNNIYVSLIIPQRAEDKVVELVK